MAGLQTIIGQGLLLSAVEPAGGIVNRFAEHMGTKCAGLPGSEANYPAAFRIGWRWLLVIALWIPVLTLGGAASGCQRNTEMGRCRVRCHLLPQHLRNFVAHIWVVWRIILRRIHLTLRDGVQKQSL